MSRHRMRARRRERPVVNPQAIPVRGWRPIRITREMYEAQLGRGIEHLLVGKEKAPEHIRQASLDHYLLFGY